MASEQDYLILTREVMLAILELQIQIAASQLVIQQRTSITLDDIRSARAEVERRAPQIQSVKTQIQALGLSDLLKLLRDYEGTIQ